MHQSSAFAGRVGQAQHHVSQPTLTLRRALDFHHALQALRPLRRADVLPARRPGITVFADAAAE
eukprot:326049-Alexandrium_andersonii.AAC.1